MSHSFSYLTSLLESPSGFPLDSLEELPIIVIAAIELLNGQVPAVGLPGPIQKEREDFRDDLLDGLKAMSGHECLTLTVEPSVLAHASYEEEGLSEKGDPVTLASINLRAISECVARICEAPTGVPTNLRLRERLLIAHLIELRELVHDYLAARLRMVDADGFEPAADLATEQ